MPRSPRPALALARSSATGRRRHYNRGSLSPAPSNNSLATATHTAPSAWGALPPTRLSPTAACPATPSRGPRRKARPRGSLPGAPTAVAPGGLQMLRTSTCLRSVGSPAGAPTAAPPGGRILPLRCRCRAVVCVRGGAHVWAGRGGPAPGAAPRGRAQRRGRPPRPAQAPPPQAPPRARRRFPPRLPHRERYANAFPHSSPVRSRHWRAPLTRKPVKPVSPAPHHPLGGWVAARKHEGVSQMPSRRAVGPAAVSHQSRAGGRDGTRRRGRGSRAGTARAA
jgi:hypothetical protein